MQRNKLKQALIDQNLRFQKLNPEVRREFPAEELERHLRSSEISVITGVRRCGKSTLLAQIAASASATHRSVFLNLEDPELEDFNLSDFAVAYEIAHELWPPEPAAAPFIFMYDEIQNIPGWEKWVRKVSEYENIKVIVTGSNSQMLSSELASSLTGRHVTKHLTPFLLSELLDHHLGLAGLSDVQRGSTETKIEINKIVNLTLSNGIFPRPYLLQDADLLPIYLNDIITRDIIRLRTVRSSAALAELSLLLTKEHTRLFNRSKSAALIGIKDLSTFSKYINYFKECFLFSELRMYSRSLRQKLRSNSKFYCVDPRLPSTVSKTAADKDGAAFENLAYGELAVQNSTIHYWHSSAGYEVDFILESARGLKAFQVSYSISSDQTKARETRALVAAAKELGIKDLCIITFGEEDRIRMDGLQISVIPIWKARAAALAEPKRH